ncbi:MAG TPA: type II/IV secretion system protein, partial [Gemmataceae bacterium]|nr:type II/IV secretion system protein [Gemmataceae bacterium]
MFLLQSLIEKGHLSEADARRAEEAQAAEPNRPIHEILLEKGIGNELHVLQALAEQFGLEFVDLSHARIESETLAVMPAKLVHRKGL